MTEWTINTLKEHFDQRFLDNGKAVDAALIAVKEESKKTESAAEKRFDLLNELRSGVATVEQLEALEKVVNALSRLVYIGLGAVLALQIALQFIKK